MILTLTSFGKYIPIWLLLGMFLGMIVYIHYTDAIMYMIITASILIGINYFKLQNNLYILFLNLGIIIGILSTYISIKLHDVPVKYGEQSMVCYVDDVNEITQYKSDYKYKYKCQMLNASQKYWTLKGNDLLDIDQAYAIKANLFTLPMPCTPLSKDMRYLFFFRNILGHGHIMSYQVMPNMRKRRSCIVQYLRNRINNTMTADNASIVRALLLGDNKIPDHIRDTFHRAGLGYIFAISGLHFSIVTYIFFLIGRWIISSILIIWMYIASFILIIWMYIASFIPILPITRNKSIKKQSALQRKYIIAQHIGNIMAILGCILYAIIVDLTESSMRNMTSSIITIVSLLHYTYIRSYYIVILSTILILMIYPYSILSPGTQLSLVASLFLTTSRNNTLKTIIMMPCITAPISIYWFGSVPIQPMLGALICIPIFSFVIMPLCIISTICGMPLIILSLLDLVTTFFIKLVDAINIFNIGEMYIQPTVYGLICWIFGLICWIIIDNKWLYRILMIASIFVFFKPIRPSIFIDYSGHNIAIYENGIIWALDTTSFHTQQVSFLTASRIIYPLQDNHHLWISPKDIYWHDVRLQLTCHHRFHKAIYKNEDIVSRLLMYRRSKPCMLVYQNNNVNVVW